MRKSKKGFTLIDIVLITMFSIILSIIVFCADATAQYFDSTKSARIGGIFNIYQNAGNGCVGPYNAANTGSHVYLNVDMAWAGFTYVFGDGQIGFDVVDTFTNVNPNLARNWGVYTNYNQVDYWHEDSVYKNFAYVSDSLTALGGDWAQWNFNRCFIMVDVQVDTSYFDPDSTGNGNGAEPPREIPYAEFRDAGYDSLLRTILCSGQLWKTTPAHEMYPLTTEYLLDMTNDTVCYIIAAAHKRMLDNYTTEIGTATKPYSFSVDNMIIGAANCYGASQSAYWNVQHLWTRIDGVQYTEDDSLAWVNVGRPILDRCVMAMGQVQVVDTVAALFADSGYVQILNISNTSPEYIEKYSTAGGGSVGFLLESRAGWITDSYTTLISNTGLLTMHDSIFVNNDYANALWDFRVMGDKDDASDLGIGSGSYTQAHGDAWSAMSFGSYLWFQHYTSTSLGDVFAYTRHRFEADGSDARFYELFKIDLGDTTESRQDTVLATGERICYRHYEKGMVLLRFTDADTSTFVSYTIPGYDSLYRIKPVGPEVNDTSKVGTTFNVKAGHAYLFLYTDQAPLITNHTDANVDVGDVTFNVEFGVHDEEKICSLNVNFNGTELLAVGYDPCQIEADAADTILAYTPLITDTGYVPLIIFALDDSSHSRTDTFYVSVTITGQLVGSLLDHMGGHIDTVDQVDNILYSIVGTDTYDSSIMWLSIDGGASYPYTISIDLPDSIAIDSEMVWTPTQIHASDLCMIKLQVWCTNGTYGDLQHTSYSDSLFSYLWFDPTIGCFGSVTAQEYVPTTTGVRLHSNSGFQVYIPWEIEVGTMDVIHLDSAVFQGQPNYSADDTSNVVIREDNATVPSTLIGVSTSAFTVGGGTDMEYFVVTFSDVILSDSTTYQVGIFPRISGFGIRYSYSDSTGLTANYLTDATWPIPTIYPGSDGTSGNLTEHIQMCYHIVTAEGETKQYMQLINKKKAGE